jgi:hypothetical protein
LIEQWEQQRRRTEVANVSDGEPDKPPTLAQQQLAAAGRDPRLDRDDRAVVGDFFDYLDEADRVRALAIGGMAELEQALDREEARLGVRRNAPELTAEQVSSLEAAWERKELAEAENANGYPHLNALTLIGLCGALDGYIETLIPSLRWVEIMGRAQKALEQAAAETPVRDEVREQLLRAAETVVRDHLWKQRPRPRGVGASRHEAVLATAGLAGQPGREIPEDMDRALTEAMTLRHVLVHRAGRVDAKALEDCPWLPYKVGEFVRISRVKYREYSAAIRAYGLEVTGRVFGGLPMPDLGRWRDYVYVQA